MVVWAGSTIHILPAESGAGLVPVLSGQWPPQNTQFWLGSASPHQAGWLVRVPPVLEETALGAAMGVGVAVVVLPPAPGSVGDFLAALGARSAGRPAAGGNSFAVAVSMAGSAWAGRYDLFSTPCGRGAAPP